MAAVGVLNFLLNALKVFCVLSSLLTIVIIFRTVTFGPHEGNVEECKPYDSDFVGINEQILQRLQKAIQFETVSYSSIPYRIRENELSKFVTYIKKAFPLIHSSPLVQYEVISNYSLLYSIKGSDASLTPYMLCAHLDVVPAEAEKWDHPPFKGEVHDGYIYGRGTIDDKQALMGMLEALEFSLSRGHTPRRAFYLAFGHDEEISGTRGALNIGKVLIKRGVKLEFLIDEGLTILTGVIPGLSGPAALIGTSEKGYCTLTLSVNITGGHSSMPGKESSIGILASAIHRLELTPQPSMFGYGPERLTLEHLAKKVSLPYQPIMANLWLFGPIVSWIMSIKPSTNAIIRTTTAVTEFHGGIKANMLAPTARATVNHRIHPAQTVQQVIDIDRKTINDERVKIDVEISTEPMAVSPAGNDVFGYNVLETSIRQVFPEAVIAPGLLMGNTDTFHYTKLTNKIYRFNPTQMTPEDIPRVHGINERLGVKNYEKTVNFWYHVMLNSDNLAARTSHTHNDEL